MTNDQADLPVELQTRGVVLVRSVLSDTQLSFLWSLMRPETAAGAVRHRSGEAYGARGLLANRPALKLGLATLMLDDLAGRALGRAAFPIDALFFDKHSEANWAVPGSSRRCRPHPLGCGPLYREECS